jgi:hypothetical protein
MPDRAVREDDAIVSGIRDEGERRRSRRLHHDWTFRCWSRRVCSPFVSGREVRRLTAGCFRRDHQVAAFADDIVYNGAYLVSTISTDGSFQSTHSETIRKGEFHLRV